MAKNGIELHRSSWNDLERAIEQVRTQQNKKPVDSVLHIWPALPGAGVGPILYGILSGVKKQRIKPSRRGTHFANFFATLASDYGVELLNEPLFKTQFDRIIVSGSDETIAFFEQQHSSVQAYGHRESIAVIDESFRDFEALSIDILQWRQQGCFSVRAIIFIGRDPNVFAQKLAAALQKKEHELNPYYSDSEWIQRAQARVVKEMTSSIVAGSSENGPWVERVNTTWKGSNPAVGCVTLHTVSTASHVLEMIDIPKDQRQGASLYISDSPHVDALHHALLHSGFTHLSKPGLMQSPPLSWLHDGRSNVDMFFE